MADNVEIILTRKMWSILEDLELSKKERLSNYVRNIEDEKQVITYSRFLKLFKEIQATNPKKACYLHELLAGSSIYEQPAKIPEKSPELVKRLNKLQAEQDQKEYETMVRNISKKNEKTIGEEFGAQVRSTSQEFVSVLNFLLTVFGCAFFAFFASQFAFDNLGFRVIFAVLIGCVVAIADLYFLARSEL